MSKDRRITWEEFRNTGLLLFVNMFLHMFGFSIVISIDSSDPNSEPKVIDVYPVKTDNRGFNSESVDKAYQRLDSYLKTGYVQVHNNNGEDK
jgi:hypothetical protein